MLFPLVKISINLIPKYYNSAKLFILLNWHRWKIVTCFHQLFFRKKSTRQKITNYCLINKFCFSLYRKNFEDDDIEINMALVGQHFPLLEVKPYCIF